MGCSLVVIRNEEKESLANRAGGHVLTWHEYGIGKGGIGNWV